MFDTERYPRMHFRSTRVIYEGARLAAVEGDVTLRGVSARCGSRSSGSNAGRARDGRETCGAEVIGRISRGAFGMDFLYPLIGDEVDLEFVVTAFVSATRTSGRNPSGRPSAASA